MPVIQMEYIDLMTYDLNISSVPTGGFDLNDPQLDPITAVLVRRLL